jgi:hypothetical protein
MICGFSCISCELLLTLGIYFSYIWKLGILRATMLAAGSCFQGESQETLERGPESGKGRHNGV